MDLTEALLHRYTTSVVSILNAVRGVATRTRARLPEIPGTPPRGLGR